LVDIDIRKRRDTPELELADSTQHKLGIHLSQLEPRRGYTRLSVVADMGIGRPAGIVLEAELGLDTVVELDGQLVEEVEKDLQLR
jgi:hypothetical protein